MTIDSSDDEGLIQHSSAPYRARAALDRRHSVEIRQLRDYLLDELRDRFLENSDLRIQPPPVGTRGRAAYNEESRNLMHDRVRQEAMINSADIYQLREVSRRYQDENSRYRSRGRVRPYFSFHIRSRLYLRRLRSLSPPSLTPNSRTRRRLH